MDKEQLRSALEERFPSRSRYDEICGCPGRLVYDAIERCGDEQARTAWQVLMLAAGDLDGFLDAAEGCADILFTYAYGRLGRLLDWSLPVSGRATVLHGISDAGGVKVGDAAGTFSLVVPDGGGGDGRTLIVAAPSVRDVNVHMMRWYNRIDGDIQVYTFDCAETAPAGDGSLVLHGTYDVYCGVETYSGGSVVAFVRCP